MATYQKYTLNLGPYQEGNLADIEITMDDNFPLTDVVITFVVIDKQRRSIISRSSADGGIAVDGQTFTIELAPADTKTHSGVNTYEIDFINDSGEPFATIGGTFTISAEINKRLN